MFKALPLVALLFAVSPAHAATLTALEQTHCRAVGQTLMRLGKAEAEVAALLKDKLGANASDKDKKTVADYQVLAESTLALGKSLEDTFTQATPPSVDDLRALEGAGMDSLTDAAQACTR
ncbi:hypothetical protein [Asticcacaulis benevestitus]|uniref:Uncharacterized protein n=1 Tax=Asticcacaulis benevestitus DSM 16100 = ATCC BAA-896 TaxID=1121022 RepID=V4PUR2_9CAUL|nr:hypothetical protein [Asticcacaulis benevestitus]ESQ91119.1 hypothetical protein ABENE_10705 [Asticcacaulis benevestitus DSM 16100 = ATCC BAA-896]